MLPFNHRCIFLKVAPLWKNKRVLFFIGTLSMSKATPEKNRRFGAGSFACNDSRGLFSFIQQAVASFEKAM
jgi:hypothetical protein